MLNIVVELEEPTKAEARSKAIVTTAQKMKIKKDLQDMILGLVSNAGDDILEDRKLKETLDQSGIEKAEIASVLAESESIMTSMNLLRAGFMPVALRVSRLFFVLVDLVNVDPMYQYSLEFFRNIYRVTIKSADKEDPPLSKKARKSFFIKEFLGNLYRNVSRSLFVKDKLLFSFLICLKIMDEKLADKGGVNIAEIRFLMTGGTTVILDRPNPAGEGTWLSNKAWAGIMQMSKELKIFEGFDKDMEKNIGFWEGLYNSSNP
jgi:dynein heavy chain